MDSGQLLEQAEQQATIRKINRLLPMSKKNAWTAALLAIIFPSIGYVYSGRYMAAVAYLARIIHDPRIHGLLTPRLVGHLGVGGGHGGASGAHMPFIHHFQAA